jgi:hypothetical protein
MHSDTRPAMFTEIIGSPGTGKTTFLYNLVNSQDKRTLYISGAGDEPLFCDEFDELDLLDFNQVRNFDSGIRVCYYTEKETFEELFKYAELGYFSNMNLILDDANAYASTKVEKPLHKICVKKGT